MVLYVMWALNVLQVTVIPHASKHGRFKSIFATKPSQNA